MNQFWGGIAIILLLRIVNFHDSPSLSPWVFVVATLAWAVYSGFRGWKAL